MQTIEKIELRNQWFNEALANCETPDEETEVYLYDLISAILVKGNYTSHRNFEDDLNVLKIMSFANEDELIELTGKELNVVANYLDSHDVSKELYELLAVICLVKEEIINCDYKLTMPNKYYDSEKIQARLDSLNEIKAVLLRFVSSMANSDENERAFYEAAEDITARIVESKYISNEDFSNILFMGRPLDDWYRRM